MGREYQLRVTAHGYGVSLKSNDNVLKLIVVIVKRLCGYTEKHLKIWFKKCQLQPYTLTAILLAD